MKQLKVKRGAALPSLTDIQTFEQENEIKFPSSLVNFYLNQNPVDTVESYFTIGEEEPYYVNAFFPFDSSNKLSMQYTFDELNEFFESKYISIGSDSGGWQYVISVQDEDYGKVYFCRMDEELEDALTLIADSFEEFIDGFEAGPEQ